MVSPRRSVAFLVVALVVLQLAVSSFLGCGESPTEIKGECNGCVFAAVLNGPPPLADEYVALEAGRTEAARLSGRQSTAPAPRVEYRACAFVVSSTNFGKNTCADGLCLYPDRIVVALWRPANVLPLVTWEATNFHLLAVGREDLTVKR